MSRIASATCPRCGAALHPVPGHEQVTCQYCGTTSFVLRAQPAAAPQPRRSNSAVLLAVLGVAVLVLVGSAVLALSLVSTGAEPGQTALSAAPEAAEVREVAPQPSTASVVASANPALQFKVQSGFTPLVADVNGDGAADVVAAIATQDTEHYAVFSGRDGRELSRTPALADADRVLAVVVGRRLITATQKGQLTGYGLANGSAQWTTALGARPIAFCGAKQDDVLSVVTDDERRLAIDLTTGRQSETKEQCKLRLTRAERGEDPRDRHDYAAPLGIESYHCGGVRVMGSENYTVADQCLARARVDTDRLDGFIGHRLWKVGQNWLAFGIRKPGAYVPMLGLVSRGKLVWKQTVPLDNPLEAQAGSPRHVGLVEDVIVATYEHEKDRSHFLAAFVVADGNRRWNVALPKGQNISSLVTSNNRVFIQGGETLLVFDAADGKLLATLGGAAQ